MKIAHRLERLMAMDDAAWARHANPWSGWTRLPILPLLALGIWSSVWIGWWFLVPVLALVGWTFWNPRAFAEPGSTVNWMSNVTFGERVWLNAGIHPIPDHHARMASRLGMLAGSGLVPLVWGLWMLDLWPVLLGLVITVTGKLWQMDRMVWIYEDMKAQVPEYAEWLR